MTEQDKRERLNKVFGRYLGVSDYVRICLANDLKINMEYLTDRLIELREQHDHVENTIA
jgi:hypothetical protein